jgi:hypothetical protein
MTEAELNDMAEKDIRMRQMLADIVLKDLDSIKPWQDIRYAPFLLAATGFAAGATFLAGAVGLGKLIAH